MSFISLVLAVSIYVFGLLGLAVDSAESKNFPAEMSVKGKTLHQQGAGHRTASLFNVKVYIAALYLEKTLADSKAAQDLIASNQMKLIELNPLYDISKEDSEKGWNLALQEACARQCQEIQKEQASFLKSVPAFKKGDHHRYEFTSDQFEFFLNEKRIYQSKDKIFAQVLLKTWIGEKPVSESLKKNLLGEKSKTDSSAE